MAKIEQITPDIDLSEAFDSGVGYHSATWVELTGNGAFSTDHPIAPSLGVFLGEVANIVDSNSVRVSGRIGCAYMRVIDGAKPENYMRWHIDNPDGSTRFHTAISTDGARVNLAWPEDPTLVGLKVADTDWRQVHQPDNGVIIGFTTEPHGVLPQPPRPGEATAIFFATLYNDRQTADLYATNNESTGLHAHLPRLEESR